MRGKVFQTSIDHLSIDPHPHVVVLVSGKQCLVVPAYTSGKFKITEKIEALKAMGHREDQVCVHMDNAKYMVNCVPGFTPRPATWFTWQCYLAEKRTFESLDPVAEMTPAGMDMIARALLRLRETRPDAIAAERHLLQVEAWVLREK